MGKLSKKRMVLVGILCLTVVVGTIAILEQTSSTDPIEKSPDNSINQLTDKYGDILYHSIKQHEDVDHTHAYFVSIFVYSDSPNEEFESVVNLTDNNSGLKAVFPENNEIQAQATPSELSTIAENKHVESIIVRPNEHGEFTNETDTRHN